MNSKAAYIIFYLLWIPLLLFSQSGDQLEIIRTDSTDFKQQKTSQGILRELVGNVHLRQGDTDMFCKSMRWWVDLEKVIVERDVQIFDKVKKLTADEAHYDLKTKTYLALGNVVLKDSVRRLSADEIKYFKLEDRVVANGHVIMSDLDQQLEIYSGQAELENSREYAKAIDNPILIKKDSTNQEEMRITGLIMELFDGGDKAVVRDSVRFTQTQASATCGEAEFYRDKNEIILKKEPKTWQKYDRLSGSEIHLFLEKNELVKAMVNDNALVTSRVDTTGDDHRYNKLSGQKITMFFENQELYKVIVENRATSFYYVIEENEEKGMNKIIGDKIFVQIKDRKIVDIWIESNPQLSEGVFYPPGYKPME